MTRDFIWTDTRDMYADGLTKGAVSRDALREVMTGIIMLRHDVEFFNRRIKRMTYHTDEHKFIHTYAYQTCPTCTLWILSGNRCALCA